MPYAQGLLIAMLHEAAHENGTKTPGQLSLSRYDAS
jgi:hypothetical protein